MHLEPKASSFFSLLDILDAKFAAMVDGHDVGIVEAQLGLDVEVLDCSYLV